MNLGISRKKYDPCKMETILFHKEEWKMNESNWWTTSWNNMEIEFPLIYLLHLLLTNILINIYISRDHDEVTIDELCEEIFLFLQETTWSIQGRRGEKRSKRNCELSGPRRESGWMKCLTYRWLGKPECLSGVQRTYLKQRKEYWLISAVSWAVYHATKDNTWYQFKI